MNTRNSDFFLDDDVPRMDGEVDPMRHLKPWHRIAVCLAFLALMVAYLGWLTER